MMNDEFDFEAFGKSIWKKANELHGPHGNQVIVPFKIPCGGTCTVEVSPPTYLGSRLVFEDGKTRTQWRHGYLDENGAIVWGEWG
jgi:hypothetical protein